MIKILFLFIAFLSAPPLFAASINDGNKPEVSIQIQGKDVQVNLPHEAYEALKKWNSQFTLFDTQDFSSSVLQLFDEGKSVPMAFIGDLVGNGTKGIVLLGEDTKTQYVIALVLRKKEWEVITVYTTTLPDIKKTEIPTLYEVPEVGVPYYVSPAGGDHAKKLKNKIGIQIEAYLGFAEIYEIKDGKAAKFIL